MKASQNYPSNRVFIFTLLVLFSAGPLSVKSCRAADKVVTNAAASVYTSQETGEFETLAKETIKALDAGDKEKMVAKLTDLETAWDAKEDALKPRDQSVWTILDKTLDKAISALRSSKTDFPKGRAALEEFIKKLAQSTKS